MGELEDSMILLQMKEGDMHELREQIRMEKGVERKVEEAEKLLKEKEDEY